MKQRIITGGLGAAGFLFVLWLGGKWYAGLIALLATVGYAEFCRMGRIPWLSRWSVPGFLMVWSILFAGMTHEGTAASSFGLDVVLTGLVIFFLLMVISRNRTDIFRTAYLFSGALYIGFGFSYMIQMRWMTDGLLWSLFVLGVIWAGDTGAYFVGRKFGKRKLCPEISPNKTVEGSAGGLILSVIAGLSIASAIPALDWQSSLVLALLIAVAGQLGDLVESAIKRTTGVKDSGGLLPGHGGVLDRFDSLLFALLVIHLFRVV
ncbi:phosphatidate cytidylyltransferase [Planifilum fimeticola]|uniref:Phosphatidate cytidylyltransferase n=1 Tax=Planifilum fimeticola TaxID=201975 RepID=A0A2T0LHP0_9BACL|nr:phosphatidate cytidylyltransferase [Planifilum fimeticola]PRX41889.1 phosphatidate cytidylyltransferase [Planifilum fimeticola]